MGGDAPTWQKRCELSPKVMTYSSNIVLDEYHGHGHSRGSSGNRFGASSWKWVRTKTDQEGDVCGQGLWTGPLKPSCGAPAAGGLYRQRWGQPSHWDRAQKPKHGTVWPAGTCVNPHERTVILCCYSPSPTAGTPRASRTEWATEPEAGRTGRRTGTRPARTNLQVLVSHCAPEDIWQVLCRLRAPDRAAAWRAVASEATHKQAAEL